MDHCRHSAARLASLLVMILAMPLPALPADRGENEGAEPRNVAATVSKERASDELALRRIKTRLWPDLYRHQDVDGLAGLLAEGFINIAPDGAVTTRGEELAWVRDNAWDPEGFAYTVDRIVWQGDDSVLVVGRGESIRSDAQGQPCRHGYVSSNLLRRAPGAALGWQALSSHVSGVQCQPLPEG